MTTSNVLSAMLSQVPGWLLTLSLLTASLALIFAGRTLVKALAFLAVGVAGAGFGGALAAQYLSPGWGVVGALLGFLMGGFLGVALLPLGVGLAMGYAGYLLALELGLGPAAALIAGAAFFVAGALLSSRILSMGTAVAGGLLLFGVLTHYAGLGPGVAVALSALATVAGLWFQLDLRQRASPRPPSGAGRVTAASVPGPGKNAPWPKFKGGLRGPRAPGG